MKNKNLAILFLIISALGFALMSTFVKLAGDIPSMEKAFFRNLVSFVVALFMIIKNKQSLIGKKENRMALIGRSFAGTLGIIFNFYAIGHMNLSDSSAFTIFSYTFFIPILKRKNINNTNYCCSYSIYRKFIYYKTIF